MFGLAVSAVAALGAWQAADVRGGTDAVSAKRGAQSRAVDGGGDPRHRLPAAVLAGAVGFAGIFDTRLAGAVFGAAVIASFIVVSSLRDGHLAGGAARSPRVVPPSVLARAGLLVRCWMQVGVAAACAAAVARYSAGAALVLVVAAACYDAGAYVTAAERRPGLRGPVVGAVTAVAAVFALTGVSVPPFAPSDVIRYGVLAALTLPLGPALARSNTTLETRADVQPPDPPASAKRASGDPAGRGRRPVFERARSRLDEPWAVRRLDSLTVAAPAWMWGLGLLVF